MMDDLIKTVAEKANLSPAVAGVAVNAVLSQLKDKLPGPLGSQLMSLVGGAGGGAASGLGAAASALGGLFGGDKK